MSTGLDINAVVIKCVFPSKTTVLSNGAQSAHDNVNKSERKTTDKHAVKVLILLSAFTAVI